MASPQRLGAAEEAAQVCARAGCGVKFFPRRPWQRYHSRDCQTRDARRRPAERSLSVVCPECGTSIPVRLELQCKPGT